MRIIVKIQTPIISYGGPAQSLIYDETRLLSIGTPVENVSHLLGKDKKGFFYADVNYDTFELEIVGRAPWQSW